MKQRRSPKRVKIVEDDLEVANAQKEESSDDNRNFNYYFGETPAVHENIEVKKEE